jgi:LacI family transcriptional regulator
MNPEEGEYQRGYEVMELLLARRGRPDGVMSYTDLLALGAMDAALHHGVRIPEELRFVGCGDDPQICRMRIPLTSIDLGGRKLGESAGKLALRAIASGNSDGARKLMVKPKLVRRKSSEISR